MTFCMTQFHIDSLVDLIVICHVSLTLFDTNCSSKWVVRDSNPSALIITGGAMFALVYFGKIGSTDRS